MAQDGSHGHQQGTDDASSVKGSAPPARDTDTTLTLGPRENSSSGTSAGNNPVAEDASEGNKTKDVEELVGSASAGGTTHSGAGQSEGNNKRSAEEVAADTDGTDDDDVSKGKRRKVGARDSKGGGGSRRKKQLPHIVTERERRKRMKGMYADLHALLPHVPEKTDKASIVTETINFIKVLEGTVAKLEKRKRDLALARQAAAASNFEAGSSAATAAPPNAGAQGALELPQGWAWLPKQEPRPAAPIGFQTWSGRNVVLSVANDDAFISVCAARRAGVLALVLSVLEKHRLDVITAHITSDGAGCMFSIHARVNAAALQQLGGDPPASEDIYKLAVSEIMVWLSN